MDQIRKLTPDIDSYRLTSYKEEAIYRINVGSSLGYKLSYQAFKEILEIEDKSKQYVFMGMLLNGLMIQKANEREVQGLLDATFELDNFDPESALEISNKDKKNRPIISLAGSGKKGIKTYNITSASAIVAACTEILIAKACSRSTSSISGSSDFIEGLGVNINLSTSEMTNVMLKCGLGLFSIEKTLPLFDSIYGGNFFAPHALSLALAGLTLPIKSDHLIYGLAHPNLFTSLKIFHNYKFPNVLCQTSTPDGIHFSDDLLPYGYSYVQGYYSNNQMGDLKELNIEKILSLPKYDYDAVKQEKIKEKNIAKALAGLMGESKPVMDTIAINAATILYISKQVDNMIDGYERSIQIMTSGQAYEKLREIIKETSGNLDQLERISKLAKNYTNL